MLIRCLLVQNCCNLISKLEFSICDLYMQIAINYLSGRIGKPYPDTIATVDLGGGSVEMTYAISEETAANAPKCSNDGEAYVHEKYILGTKYHLYAYRFLSLLVNIGASYNLISLGDTNFG